MKRLERLLKHIEEKKDSEFTYRVIDNGLYEDVMFYELLVKYGENSRRFDPFLSAESPFSYEDENTTRAITWGGYDDKEFFFTVHFSYHDSFEWTSKKIERPPGFIATKKNIYEFLVENKDFLLRGNYEKN